MRDNGSGQILLAALRDAGALGRLDSRGWDRLIREARHSGVLSRLAMESHELGSASAAPVRAQNQLLSARRVADHHERSIRWEVGRLRHALRREVDRIILLKGAAYVMADLPARTGRLVSDVDLMFDKDDLEKVEQTLLREGWEAMKPDSYDQRYYRQWMHELPPLRHATRRTVVDLHHAILPETARLSPDPRKLMAAAVPIGSGLAVLAPEDMVLHSATHLFVDGDLAGGLRDLVDLDTLMRHFASSSAGFWERIGPRSIELELTRPLYYALRYCLRWLDTPVPDALIREVSSSKPVWPVAPLMDALAAQALVPRGGAVAGGGATARWLLYVRSHWARMPPHLLLGHLTRKSIQRWFGGHTDE